MTSTLKYYEMLGDPVRSCWDMIAESCAATFVKGQRINSYNIALIAEYDFHLVHVTADPKVQLCGEPTGFWKKLMTSADYIKASRTVTYDRFNLDFATDDDVYTICGRFGPALMPVIFRSPVATFHVDDRWYYVQCLNWQRKEAMCRGKNNPGGVYNGI